jgi:hypothetical protein
MSDVKAIRKVMEDGFMVICLEFMGLERNSDAFRSALGVEIVIAVRTFGEILRNWSA